MIADDLGNGIHRIGDNDRPSLFPSYTYLITSGDRGLIIDPGSRENFPEILKHVGSVIPPKRISFIVITSELPEACSNLPLWENSGFSGKVLLHWKAYLSAIHYGWKQKMSTIKSKRAKIRIGDSREFVIMHIPGIPTPGSICCFDIATKNLFSGMLFGSFGGDPSDADEESWGRIESFHDQFFSHIGNQKEIHTVLSAMRPERILPRNGPPLTALIEQAIELVSPGGEERTPVPENSDDMYTEAILESNRRLCDLFSEDELRGVLEKMNMPFSGDMRPVAGGQDPKAVFNHYLNEIRRIKGVMWLSMIKPVVEKKLDSAGAETPRVFELFEDEIDHGIGGLIQEIQKLKSENFELQKSIIEASDDQLKDSVTGFYNELFFEEYVGTLVPPEENPDMPEGSVIFIRLDGIKHLNQTYGSKAGDSTLKGLANFLLNHKSRDSVFFRLNGPLFACLLPGKEKAAAVEYGGEIQKLIGESDQFIAKISVSEAVLSFGEMNESNIQTGRFFTSMMKIGKERLKLLDKLGPGSICSESQISLRRSSGTVLLIESNRFEADLFENILEREGFETHSVTNGNEAIEKADLYRPDVIVSEIFISQMDGFQIRQQLLGSLDLKNVPFILISREKSDSSVQRAHDLGIRYYFKKPFMAKEISGVIKMLIKEAQGDQPQ